MRRSKKKRPPREVKQLKERSKIESYVFDRNTLLTLSGFISKGILGTVDFPISTGKEANVFRATAGDRMRGRCDYLAVKVYKVETSRFIRMKEYLLSDPRFEGIKRTRRQVIYAWTRKEFRNLKMMEEAGVRAPRPYFFAKNVLIMEFLGEEGIPDSTLQQVGTENPERDLGLILDDVKKLYKHNIVHSDISEYNILMHGYPDPKPYLIDCGQAVILSHPKAENFLERDVRSILRYFRRYGIRRDEGEILEWIRG